MGPGNLGLSELSDGTSISCFFICKRRPLATPHLPRRIITNKWSRDCHVLSGMCALGSQGRSQAGSVLSCEQLFLRRTFLQSPPQSGVHSLSLAFSSPSEHRAPRNREHLHDSPGRQRMFYPLGSATGTWSSVGLVPRPGILNIWQQNGISCCLELHVIHCCFHELLQL